MTAPLEQMTHWTVGQLSIFAIVMAVAGAFVVFVWRIRATFWKPASCPSCNATVTRDTKTCPHCGETL